MRVLICGAGQVGYNIAAYLAQEENDVTLVDNDPSMTSRVNDELDVNGIVGHASDPDVLDAAGANDADLIIAVTQSDEVNMVACQVAHSLFSVPKKIARIRQQTYLDPAWSNLFSRAHMPIDMIISPELVIAEDIYQRLAVPGTTSVIPLADEKAHVIGVICDADCPVINTPLSQIKDLFPDLSFEIMGIMRQNFPIAPDDREQLFVDDEVFIVVDTKHLARLMAVFGHEEKEARRIVIMGGGGIGYTLAKYLKEKTFGTQIKIIERDLQRAQFLSEQFEDLIILNGDGLGREILEEANIRQAETFVAVTDDDENNILGSLLAKQYGCRRSVTLVNNKVYSPLVGPLGVDAMISPRSTIVASIMQHIRRGRIHGIHPLRDGFAEIIEAEVSDGSAIANKTLGKIDFPPYVTLGAIIRKDELIIPKASDTIKPGDIVIIMAEQRQVRAVEKMFSVQVDMF